MAEYRKRQESVQAEQFTGEIPGMLYDENNEITSDITLGVGPDQPGYTHITLPGVAETVLANLGDWIVEVPGKSAYEVWANGVFQERYEEAT